MGFLYSDGGGASRGAGGRELEVRGEVRGKEDGRRVAWLHTTLFRF